MRRLGFLVLAVAVAFTAVFTLIARSERPLSMSLNAYLEEQSLE
jgi:hypothetical protein